ncbi:cap-specific mRNA (nucleoside-2'-O-)-methyltransferase 1-like [Physella acuta]|uniref:cap-specific mRNA (nucleoside-2'-O-)-methyltransferase 1-like n=1 Tax=Physella acuta TaxID=109671 RepID=UPI0027DCFCFD|nr:cap-specific mRNA (nucleoside-2'-O-)-methyltransferase 1-like [Physella acuta]
MSTLTDSEDEADQRPSFAKVQTKTVAPPFSNTQGKKLSTLKRPFAKISSDGDAGQKASFALSPTKFVKKRDDTQVEMSEAAKKMMAKMGHKEGEGLGKHGQGRTQIVEASNQRGRRGLGMVVPGLEPADVDWDFSKEEIIIDEVIEWIPPYTGQMPTLEEMMQWKVVGPKKREIDDETNFCSEESLMLVLNGKSVFDVLEPEEMRRARTRSNPYETIRGAFFLNRAAMKMANMDATLGFMFTDPKSAKGEPLVEPNELLYFVDICAGPGGFSEYVLWRRKGESKGFGMTLKGANDFKLEDFFAGPPEMFEPHYGVGGKDGDGDIFRPDNQAEFAKFVLANTDGKGVHFVMADGGFSVEGQENIQEILSKQLYLCQFLVALMVLRPGGHFVCKLFDLFTPFSVGLVYLMNMIFEQVSICKPVTSRPANSERYIVCKNMKSNKETVQNYFHTINVDLCHYMSALSTEDILHIVPLNTLINDELFFTYMVNSNEELAKLQAINLKKIEVFTKNSNLYESRQASVRKDCLAKWKIPDEVRAAPGRPEPEKMFNTLIKDGYSDVFGATGDRLTPDKLHSIKSLYSYSCIVRGEGSSFYLLGCGRSNCYKWDGKNKGKWQKLDFRVELPSKTLLEVQSVTELRGEGKGQKRQTSIHVLDAFFLCGEDVCSMSFEKRQEKLSKFIKALRKTTRSDLHQIHKLDIFPLHKADVIFDKLAMRQVKGANKPRLCYCAESGNFFLPSGLSIIRTVKEPWNRCQSKSTGHAYWYNLSTGKSLYECPPESIATVRDCKLSVLLWDWEEGVKVHKDQEKEYPGLVSKSQFLEHIEKIKLL